MEISRDKRLIRDERKSIRRADARRTNEQRVSGFMNDRPRNAARVRTQNDRVARDADRTIRHRRGGHTTLAQIAVWIDLDDVHTPRAVLPHDGNARNRRGRRQSVE